MSRPTLPSADSAADRRTTEDRPQQHRENAEAVLRGGATGEVERTSGTGWRLLARIRERTGRTGRRFLDCPLTPETWVKRVKTGCNDGAIHFRRPSASTNRRRARKSSSGK